MAFLACSRIRRTEVVGEDVPRMKEDPVTTRGVLFIHTATSALCPHVEWAVAGVLGVSVPMQWTPQPEKETNP